MDKSAITWFLDCVRYLLILSGTVTVLYLCGTRLHRLLSIIAVIPVCVVTFCFVDFLTLPLYFLTPEHRVVSIISKAIEEDDFDKALRVLEAYEKRYSVKLQASRPVMEKIRRVSKADLFFASLLLLLLLLSGYETVLDRLTFLHEHPIWKSVFSRLVFGLSVVAITWKIWSEWREFEFKRARRDVENILKKRGRASFKRLSLVKPKYAPEFLNKLIETYPNVFRRITLKKKKEPAITLVKE